MPDYSPSEIIDIMMILGECRNNFGATSRLYAQRYPNRRTSNPNRIKILFNKSRNQGRLKRCRRKKIIRNTRQSGISGSRFNVP